MDPHERFRKQVRGFWAWVLSLLIAGLGPFGAQALIHSPSAATRIVGVAVGTLAWVPMGIMIALIIRAGDEFTRRIHLLGMSLAFGGGLLILMLVHWLTEAELIDYPSYPELWLAMAVVWVICLFIAKRYYERAR